MLTAIALNWQFLRGRLSGAAAGGALGALIAIANTAAVVGFGGVAKLTSGFQAAVDFMTHLPGEPLIGAAVAVCVIAGLTGLASGGLDSLPHNGYVVTTLRAICRESYSAAYPAVAALTIVVPIAGTILAIALLSD